MTDLLVDAVDAGRASALLDLGRHLLAKGFGKVTPEYAAVAGKRGAVELLCPCRPCRSLGPFCP